MLIKLKDKSMDILREKKLASVALWNRNAQHGMSKMNEFYKRRQRQAC